MFPGLGGGGFFGGGGYANYLSQIRNFLNSPSQPGVGPTSGGVRPGVGPTSGGTGGVGPTSGGRPISPNPSIPIGGNPGGITGGGSGSMGPSGVGGTVSQPAGENTGTAAPGGGLWAGLPGKTGPGNGGMMPGRLPPPGGAYSGTGGSMPGMPRPMPNRR